MLICDFCDKNYKSKRGLENHKKKVHAKLDTGSQTNSPSVPTDEFSNFKTHINAVINSFSEAFFTKISDIENTLSTLKINCESHKDISTINYEELKDTLLAQQMSKPIITIAESQPQTIATSQQPQQNIAVSQQPKQTIAESQQPQQTIAESQHPQHTPEQLDWQTPKAVHAAQMKQYTTLQTPLTNRFSGLNDCVTSTDIADEQNNARPATNQPANKHTRARSPPRVQKNRVFPNQHPENERDLRKKQIYPPSRSNNDKPLVAIIGDSTIKNVTSFQVRGILRDHSIDGHNINVVVKPFLGAMTRTMSLYLDAVLSELDKKPELIILHVSTNDIRSGKSPETITNDYRKVIDHIKKLNIKIVISLVTCRNDAWSEKVTPVNHKLI